MHSMCSDVYKAKKRKENKQVLIKYQKKAKV